MSKSKIILVVIGSLIVIAGLVAGVMLVFQNQNIKNKAAPATTFSITPSSQNKLAGESFSFVVVVNIGSNQVIGIDVVMNFNPQIFQIDSVTKSALLSDFTQIRNNIDNSAGKISYSAYTTDPTKALNGSNLSVLTIAARVKSGATSGTYNFTFDSSSAAAGTGEGQNVLTGTTPGSVTVTEGSGGGATATPTSTPTSTPTPTSGGTDGSNSTSTPTPTLRSTATPTPRTTSTSRPTGSNPTPPPLPVSGTNFPTVMGIIVGIFAVIGSLFLVL